MNIGKLLLCLICYSAASAFAGETPICHGKESTPHPGALFRSKETVYIDDRVIQDNLRIDKAIVLLKQLKAQGKCIIDWNRSLREMKAMPDADSHEWGAVWRDAITDMGMQQALILKNQNQNQKENSDLAECRKERDSLRNTIANTPSQNKSVTTNLIKQSADAVSKIESSPKAQHSQKSAAAQ